MSRRSAKSRARINAFAADVEIAVVAVRGAAVDRPARAQRSTAACPQLLRHGRNRASSRSSASFAAAPKPTHSSGDRVPERRPRSCPPPWMNGAGSAPLRIHSAPMPLGPWILCAETATRSGPLQSSTSAERLDRVAQHQGAGLVRHVGDLGDRLGDANLIVDHASPRPAARARRARARADRGRCGRPGLTGQDGQIDAPAPPATRRCRAPRHARSRP